MEDHLKMSQRVARDIMRIEPEIRLQKVFKLTELAELDQK